MKIKLAILLFLGAIAISNNVFADSASANVGLQFQNGSREGFGVPAGSEDNVDRITEDGGNLLVESKEMSEDDSRIIKFRVDKGQNCYCYISIKATLRCQSTTGLYCYFEWAESSAKNNPQDLCTAAGKEGSWKYNFLVYPNKCK